MLRLAVVFLCLLAEVWGKTPRPLADVPIRTPDLKKINVRQYRGKVVALVLFSTTCGDCIKTIEIMTRIQKDFGPRGVQVLAAAFNDNAAYMIQPFAQRYRPGFPMGYLDKEGAIKIADIPKDMRPFVPIAIFIDRGGTVRVQYYGDDPVFKQEEKAFRAIVDSLLKFDPDKK
jgi:thiol-disulfide isomerase/thioredoxin